MRRGAATASRIPAAGFTRVPNSARHRRLADRHRLRT